MKREEDARQVDDAVVGQVGLRRSADVRRVDEVVAALEQRHVRLEVERRRAHGVDLQRGHQRRRRRQDAHRALPVVRLSPSNPISSWMNGTKKEMVERK